MSPDPRVVLAALLWARNHIDVGIDPDLKDQILHRLDQVLLNADLTGADLALFRQLYPPHPARPDKAPRSRRKSQPLV